MQTRSSFFIRITWAYAAAMTIFAGALLVIAHQQRTEISFLQIQVGPRAGESVSTLASVSSLDGSTMVVDFPADKSHRWTLLTFLTADCVHCLQSTRALNRAAEQADLEARIVGIAVDSIRAWKSHSPEIELKFPLIEIPYASLSTFRINRVPSTILVDREGTIRHVLPGALEFDGLKELLRSTVDVRSPAKQAALH